MMTSHFTGSPPGNPNLTAVPFTCPHRTVPGRHAPRERGRTPLANQRPRPPPPQRGPTRRQMICPPITTLYFVLFAFLYGSLRLDPILLTLPYSLPPDFKVITKNV